MLVRDWMSQPVITVDEDDSMQEATRLLKQNSIRMLPVMKSERLTGVITDRDLNLTDRLIFIYGIILEHGGDLFIPKEGGALESLTILLPTVHNPVEMFEESGISESDLHGAETILLVDDEAIIWDVVIDMLQTLGYTVILAEHGRDCVEIFRDNPGKIDLVLLDMVMPEMTGHEAFFELKKIDPNVKVLLQSGYIAQKDAQDVLLGCDRKVVFLELDIMPLAENPGDLVNGQVGAVLVDG